jgi:hypothetical protein
MISYQFKREQKTSLNMNETLDLLNISQFYNESLTNNFARQHKFLLEVVNILWSEGTTGACRLGVLNAGCHDGITDPFSLGARRRQQKKMIRQHTKGVVVGIRYVSVTHSPGVQKYSTFHFRAKKKQVFYLMEVSRSTSL